MTGLRERKKAKTRALIREHAVRLCAEQGYEATTVEQIADAAEVSVSTVFRYFPTKESLIVPDEPNQEIAEAFRAQSAELSPIAALRAAFATLSADADHRLRQALVLSVPELWAASLANIRQTQRMIAGLLAERTGRAAADPAIQAASGAVFGIVLQTWLNWAENPELDAAAVLDDGLVRLERGLPLD